VRQQRREEEEGGGRRGANQEECVKVNPNLVGVVDEIMPCDRRSERVEMEDDDGPPPCGELGC